jgi:hypothetical protein
VILKFEHWECKKSSADSGLSSSADETSQKQSHANPTDELSNKNRAVL